MSEKKYKICFGTQSYPANDEMVNNNVFQSGGIYLSEFDAETGDLSDPHLIYPTRTSSFFAYDELRKILYVTGIMDPDGTEDEVAAFQYYPAANGSQDILVLLNAVKTNGKTACHLSFDPDRRFLAVANYSSGSLVIFGICSDGSIGSPIFFHEYEGNGPNTKRQECAHVHSAYFLKTENDLRLFALDLGRDSVIILKFDTDRNEFVSDPDVPALKLEPGSGPRHATFLPVTSFQSTRQNISTNDSTNSSKNDHLFFVLNELNSTLAAFYLNFHEKHLAILSSGCRFVIPDDFRQKTSNRACYFGSEAAEIEITETPDGPVLYCSNRGHNSISVFSFDNSSVENICKYNNEIRSDLSAAKSSSDLSAANPLNCCIPLNVSLVQSQSTFGVFPRFFSTDPSGNWMIIDNERSGSILVFKRNPKNGRLDLVNKEPKKLAWPLTHAFLR